MINDNENNKIVFHSNGFLTIGVEIELQIINDKTFNLESRSEELLQKTKELEIGLTQKSILQQEILTVEPNNPSIIHA